VIHDPRGYLRCFSDHVPAREGRVPRARDERIDRARVRPPADLACEVHRMAPDGMRHGRGSRENRRDARPASVWLSIAMDGDRRREERRQQEPAEAAGRADEAGHDAVVRASRGTGGEGVGSGSEIGGSVSFPGLSCRRPWTNVNMPICRATSPRMRAVCVATTVRSSVFQQPACRRT
jgi:hypothetical protein